MIIIKKILRDILILLYGVGCFELMKFLFPGIDKDWILIVTFINVGSIVIDYCLRDHDEWVAWQEKEKNETIS